jgi:hypothetical protein
MKTSALIGSIALALVPGKLIFRGSVAKHLASRIFRETSVSKLMFQLMQARSLPPVDSTPIILSSHARSPTRLTDIPLLQ